MRRKPVDLDAPAYVPTDETASMPLGENTVERLVTAEYSHQLNPVDLADVVNKAVGLARHTPELVSFDMAGPSGATGSASSSGGQDGCDRLARLGSRLTPALAALRGQLLERGSNRGMGKRRLADGVPNTCLEAAVEFGKSESARLGAAFVAPKGSLVITRSVHTSPGG